MGYIRKNRKTNREYAIEALEILKKEGIDVNSIAPKRSFNGVKRYIFLKEVRDDRINEIIKRYGLNPNLNLGSQIYIMRTKYELLKDDEKDRILNLGIKKRNINLGNSSGEDFSNQIQETLFILEKLREDGVDTAFIPQIVNRATSYLKNIDCPEIGTIIRKLGLSEDLPIGRRISTVVAEYSQNNKRHYYRRTDEDVKKIKNLGILNSYEENVEESMSVIKKLIERGIDVTSIKKDVVDSNGRKRKRYLFEIEDPNINQVISELGLPRYYLIGKRLIQVKSYMLSEKYPETKRIAIKDKLVEWDLYRDRGRKDSQSELSILDEEQKELKAKLSKAKELKERVSIELKKSGRVIYEG